jgi:hypothetical protein
MIKAPMVFAIWPAMCQSGQLPLTVRATRLFEVAIFDLKPANSLVGFWDSLHERKMNVSAFEQLAMPVPIRTGDVFQKSRFG